MNKMHVYIFNIGRKDKWRDLGMKTHTVGEL